MSDLYGEDLAFVHHVAFGDLARSAGPEIAAMLRASGIRHGRIVDLGCGSGILAKTLTAAGFDVLGVDASAAMLEIARDEAKGSEFVRASIWEVALPRSVAILCIGEGLSYFMPEDPALQLESFCRRAFDALEPGGYLIFDLITAAGGGPMHYRTECDGPDWWVEVEVHEDPARTLLTRSIAIRRRVDGVERRSHELHKVRIFGSSEVEHLLLSAGFSVQVGRAYGAHPLAPRRCAFIARR